MITTECFRCSIKSSSSSNSLLLATPILRKQRQRLWMNDSLCAVSRNRMQYLSFRSTNMARNKMLCMMMIIVLVLPSLVQMIDAAQREVSDFDLLNQRWKRSKTMGFFQIQQFDEKLMIEDSLILGIDINLEVVNMECLNLSIYDIDWIYWKDDTSSTSSGNFNDTTITNTTKNVLSSNFTVLGLSIDCILDYKWNYMFLRDSGSIYIRFNDTDIHTSFTVVPNNISDTRDESSSFDGGSSFFNFSFNDCYASNINVKQVKHLGQYPRPNTTVTQAMQDVLQATATQQMENSLCTIMEQLDGRFNSFISKLTESLLLPASKTSADSASNDHNSKSKHDTTTTAAATTATTQPDPLLLYEQSMNVSGDDIHLLDFYDVTVNSFGFVGTILNLLNAISSDPITVPATDTNPCDNMELNDTHFDKSKLLSSDFSYWSSWLTGDTRNASRTNVYTVDLAKNTLLNGEDGFESWLTKVPPSNGTSESFLTSLLSSNSSTNSEMEYGSLSNLFGVSDVLVMNATIYGLGDPLASISSIEVIGNYTLAMGFEIQDISVVINMEVDRMPIQSWHTRKTESIQFAFNVSMTDAARIKAGVLLAIDDSILSSIQLGSLLHSNDAAVACLSSALYDRIRLTGFESKKAFNLASVSFEVLESIGMDRIATTSMEYIYTALEDSFDKILSNIVTGIDLSTLLASDTNKKGQNEAKLTTLTSADTTCPVVVNGTNSEFVDVRDLFLTPTKARECGGSGKEPYGTFAAGLIEALQPTVSDWLSFSTPGVAMNYSTSFKLGRMENNYFELIVSDFYFKNDRMGNDTILLDCAQGEAFKANNILSLDNAVVGGNVVFGLQLGSHKLTNVMAASISIHTFRIVFKLIAKAREYDFLRFPIKSFFNVDCWLTMFPDTLSKRDGMQTNDNQTSLSVRDLTFTLENITLDVECVQCSPVIEKAVNLIATSNYTYEIMNIIQRITDFVSSGDNSIIQLELDRMVSIAPMHCPNHVDYNASIDQATFFERLADSFAVPKSFRATKDEYPAGQFSYVAFAALVIGLGSMLLLVIAGKIASVVVSRRFEKTIATMQEDEVLALVARQMEEDRKEDELDLFSGPLFLNKRVPHAARYLIPLLLLAASGFFWSGLVSRVVELMVTLKIAEEEAFPIMDMHFSVLSFTRLWWESGDRVFSALLLFTQIWPSQMKIFGTMALWVFPTSFLSVSRRGSWLKGLEPFGRFGVFLLFALVIGFSVYQNKIETKIFTISYIVVPAWGFFSLMIGQIINEVVCNVVIHYHDDIIATFEAEYDEKKRVATNSNTDLSAGQVPEGCPRPISCSESDDSELACESRMALCESNFKRPHRGDSGHLRVRRPFRYLVATLCVAAVAILLVASVMPMYHFDVSGLLGVLLDFRHTADHSSSTQNVFSMVRALVTISKFMNSWEIYLGLGVLGAFFLSTVIVVPILEAISMLALWLWPMELPVQVRLQGLIDILHKWQYTDMFFFSMYVCSVQGDSLSRLLASNYCRTVKNVLRSFIYWGFVDDNFDQCVIAEREVYFSTLGFLTVFAILLWLKVFVGGSLAHKIEDVKSKSKYEDITLERYDHEQLRQNVGRLRPTPVRFTDRFRWALRGECKSLDQNTSFETFRM